MQATTQVAKNGFLRAAALAVSIAGTLFWLYTLLRYNPGVGR